MILDHIKGHFVLRVDRRENPSLPRTLMTDYGLDFSLPASTADEAVLFTRDPFTAASFVAHGTPAAREALAGISSEIEASWRDHSTAHIACPSDQELWPFQKADIEYALRRPHTLVADEPGLGKTPIAICYANEIRAKKVLAIVPASIRLQWEARIQQWSKMERVGPPECRRVPVHVVLHGRRGVNEDASWIVVSYEMARTPEIARALATRCKFDLLIMDEAHYAKEHTSQRTRAIFGGGVPREGMPAPLAASIPHILALSGTPLPNRPREAYTLARHLCHDSIDWMSEEAFKYRFNPSRRIERIDPNTGLRTYFVDERSGRHAELQNRLRAYFMTRHLKRQVMKQLHMPVYDLVYAEETGPVKAALAAESLLHIDPEDLAGADAAALGMVATVRRQMGLALAPQGADYAIMQLEGGEEKLVLFGWHVEVLDILEKKLHRYGVRRVDGSTSQAAKARYVKEFQEDPHTRVIIGNHLSLGTGTDGLQTVCNRALIVEPDWVPGNNIQCFDRLDRGGQTRQVFGEILVAPGSFAERVLASALRKMKTIHNVLDRKETFDAAYQW